MLNRRTTSVFSQKDISVCLLAAIGHVNTQEDEDHGEGGYGDEALAIAFYCALKHFDSFEEAMIAAVNHSGDSDSTGAVTGNILGAAVGYEAIPQFFKDDLEMHDRFHVLPPCVMLGKDLVDLTSYLIRISKTMLTLLTLLIFLDAGASSFRPISSPSPAYSVFLRH